VKMGSLGFHCELSAADVGVDLTSAGHGCACPSGLYVRLYIRIQRLLDIALGQTACSHTCINIPSRSSPSMAMYFYNNPLLHSFPNFNCRCHSSKASINRTLS
jgi:hypothetical protein